MYTFSKANMLIIKFAFLVIVSLASCGNNKAPSPYVDTNNDQTDLKSSRKKEENQGTGNSDKKNSREKAGSKPGACNTNLWKYTYNPDRLEIIDSCKEVTGTVEEISANDDGDEHMLLKLDPGQEYLLKKKNKEKKNGDLVIELVCANKITAKKAMGACTGYVNNIQIPKMGSQIKVTGSYVIDSHNGWTEIHPVTKIEELSSK
ncbi:MAG: hypothetical protein H0X33_03000 [Taibaiella sp.]|nr:hypothetical protein [Taibaiella sp.]